MKRAGLDYWKDVDLVLWESWDAFYASVVDTSRMFLLTTKASTDHWDADFKLHAPHNTTLEGRIKDGKLVDLKVTPESRRKDVEVMDD